MNPPIKQPPLSPRLSIYRWRLTMFASIAHRASGMFLVLFMPALFWLLLSMAHGSISFAYGLTWLQGSVGTVVLWLTCTALFYHMANGVRFLLLDIGKTDSREAMRLSAKIVVLSTIIFALLLAIKI
ncbi:MAG: succinate dehydrogenase, cytochrome b556 subunit [Ghiorsea sp.]|nr:succinate dehydrogenase, cytochrome b556 subunit [Ghiorsea sp.]